MEEYRSLEGHNSAEPLRIKGSKFIGLCYPVTSKDEIVGILDEVRSKHPKANHCCYAWKLGTDRPEYRYNDDGEPSNSAGKPIYGQILSHDLTFVLVVVVRYFGGTKLGVGGLIQAYREAARMCLDSAEIAIYEVKESFILSFEYAYMDRVMRVIKERHAEILSSEMGLEAAITVSVKKRDAIEFMRSIKNLHQVELTTL